MHAYLYNGYWRDIGTIPSFLEASIELTRPDPPLNLYQPDRPIYTHARFLPGVKIHGCQVTNSVICEGSVIGGGTIRDSVIGIRSFVRSGTVIEESIVMGTNFDQHSGRPGDGVPFGIGHDCHIRKAIIDRGACIGDGVKLVNEAGVDEADGDGYAIRGGVIVIPAEASIPPGTVI